MHGFVWVKDGQLTNSTGRWALQSLLKLSHLKHPSHITTGTSHTDRRQHVLVSHIIHLTQQLNQQFGVWGYVFIYRRYRCTFPSDTSVMVGGSMDSYSLCLTSLFAHLSIVCYRSLVTSRPEHQGAWRGMPVPSTYPPLILKGDLALQGCPSASTHQPQSTAPWRDGSCASQ